MATCYRHPDRETGVSCSNCGKPICPDCMTPTPVGMRCPECSRDRTPVRTMASIHGDPVLTYVLIGICVLLFFGSRSSSTAYFDLVLAAGPVADGELWRPISGGFLHAQGSFGFIHIGFNMYLLYILGQLLEPSLGKWRFGGIYFASLLTGAFGAILLSSASELHRRRLGRGVRADGRGRRVPARPRHRPDAVAGSARRSSSTSPSRSCSPGSTSRSAATSAACSAARSPATP